MAAPPPAAAQDPPPAEPAEPAEPPEPAEGAKPATSLIGDVIIFNDEIVEPVSAPISTCGPALKLFSTSTATCADASRVSDDDA